MYGSGPVGRELVGSEAVQRSRSEAGKDFSTEISISYRLLNLVVVRLGAKLITCTSQLLVYPYW